jgi:hypothetical protein
MPVLVRALLQFNSLAKGKSGKITIPPASNREAYILILLFYLFSLPFLIIDTQRPFFFKKNRNSRLIVRIDYAD